MVASNLEAVARRADGKPPEAADPFILVEDPGPALEDGPDLFLRPDASASR